MIEGEPLKPTEVRKLIHHILKNGDVTYSRPHAIERMEEREMDNSDCLNILRAGKPQPGEYENGSWRYRVSTPKMAVVITFISTDELLIVTAWRDKK